MIIQEVTESQFIREFDEYNRSNNFSIEGRRVLYEWFNELYTDDNPFNLDIIAICCDFSEYKNIDEYLQDYSNTHIDLIDDKKLEFEDLLKDDKDFNYKEDEFKEWFKDCCQQDLEEDISLNTTLLKIDDDLDKGFIIQAY